MSEISIKVKVGNRVYPITIEPEEEARVKRAAELVNENAKKLRDNYAVNDWIDLLAMSAFEYANKHLEKGQPKGSRDQAILENLTKVEKQVEEILNLE